MRSLVAAVAVTSLSSCGPRARDLGFKLGDGRIVWLGGGGDELDLQGEIADIGFRVIDHRELDAELAGSGLRNAVAGQLQIFGQRMLVREDGVGGLGGAGLLCLRGVGGRRGTSRQEPSTGGQNSCDQSESHSI